MKKDSVLRHVISNTYDGTGLAFTKSEDRTMKTQELRIKLFYSIVGFAVIACVAMITIGIEKQKTMTIQTSVFEKNENYRRPTSRAINSVSNEQLKNPRYQPLHRRWF